ncbi:MAG: hypothetical protein II295_02260 [Akkermansia sp.]|nr:hypothetical protein [Akkermansia sp.]
MSFDMQQSAPDGSLPSTIRFWCDPVLRTGYENMAADELLSRRPEAWLRIYGWAKPAVSFGYFDSTPVAAAIFPGEGIEYIRRWTGGGIVDHRKGYTYTVTLPAREGCIYPPADKLYKWIHGALAESLKLSGVECTLLVEDAPDGGRACWASPVASDIVDTAGNKLAGAGQRRYRGAVLHQGLIQECEPLEGWQYLLACNLAPIVETVEGNEPYPGFEAELAELCRTKYCTEAWNDESHGRRKNTSS